jgi:hypothetical protein
MVDLATGNPLRESIPPTFTNFANLPPEIRSQIWEYALPNPRIIHIKGNIRELNEGKGCFADSLDHPVLLHACHESRTIALTHYRCAFEPHLRHPVYFDPSQDVLLMQNDNILNDFFERSKGSITSEVTTVKFIAIDLIRLDFGPEPDCVISLFLSMMAVTSALATAVTRFGNLQEIVLLKPCSEWDLQNSFSCACDIYKEDVRRNYSDDEDLYARKRREFLRDDEGNIPITTTTTVEDFWNRFS